MRLSVVVERNLEVISELTPPHHRREMVKISDIEMLNMELMCMVRRVFQTTHRGEGEEEAVGVDQEVAITLKIIIIIIIIHIQPTTHHIRITVAGLTTTTTTTAAEAASIKIVTSKMDMIRTDMITMKTTDSQGENIITMTTTVNEIATAATTIIHHGVRIVILIDRTIFESVKQP
jgi:hypothetical protein